MKSRHPSEDESLHFSSTPEVREPYQYSPKDDYPQTKEEAIAQGKAKIEKIKNTHYEQTRKMYKQRYDPLIVKRGSDKGERFRLEVFVRGYEHPCHDYTYYTQTNMLVAEIRRKERPNKPEDKELHDKYAAEGAYDSEVQPFITNEDETKMFITGTKPLYASNVLHNLMLDLKCIHPPTAIKSTGVIETKTVHILDLMGIKTNHDESVSFDKNSDEYSAIMAGYDASINAHWLQQDHPHKEITKIIVTGAGNQMINAIEYIIGDRT